MMEYPANNYTKDPEALHFYVNDIRVLTPREYDALKMAIPMDQHKVILDVLMITGMRYAEMLRFHNRREWYIKSRNIIHLPEEAHRKAKRKQLERNIYPLPNMFNYLIDDFFKIRKPPMEPTWNRNLQRWSKLAGINPYGMTSKTTRKTIESWMIASGIEVTNVCLRAGHNTITSMLHYQSLAFNDDELRDIRKRLTEWGILRNMY